jgi:hypothetical protein
MPEDVRALMDREVNCDTSNYPEHPEARIAVLIKKEQRRNECSTLDADEKKLRAKYQGNGKVLKAIEDAKSVGPQ